MIDKGRILIILFILSLCLCFGSVYANKILDPIDDITEIDKIENLTKIISNDTLKDDLRDVGYIQKTNSESSDKKKYISYNSTEKELFIEDYKYKSLVKIKLLSDYTTYVSAGDDVKVAEFLLIDYDISVSLFDEIYSFDIDSDYVYQERNYTLKYGEDYLVEVCHDFPDFEENITYCYNTTETNWTVFNNLSELPYKDIKIGLFTDTVFGDNIEWIPTIHGFDIVEWADWDVTSGTKHEFDTVNGQYNSLVKINDTHYLNTYSGTDFDGYAVVLVVDLDTLTITSGTKHEFDTDNGDYSSLVKINDTHYLNTYAGGDGDDGYAVVLVVDLNTLIITSGTKHEFDNVNGQYNSLVKINDTHYINTYMGNDDDGYAVVLTVDLDTLIITSGTKHEFDTVTGYYNSLVKINDTHYLNTYSGNDFDGYAVVLTVDLDTLIITSGTKHEFDTVTGFCNSLVKINDTHYINTYGGDGDDGYAVVLTVDLDTLIITSGTKHEFDTVTGRCNSLVKINDTHYLNSYTGTDYDGYSVVLTVEGDIPPRYSDNSTNSTLKGTNVLHALKWEDGVGLDTYIFSFDNGTGTLVNDSLVDISGTNHWSNVTKGVNHTVGSTIRWQVFANDTYNNWNETPIYTYITIAMPVITANVSDPATVYTNTDWEINITATDEDSATMTGYTQFYMNGTSYSTVQEQSINNDTNTLIATLGYANFLKNYNLTAETWVGDGTTNTSKTNLTVTVSNSVPTTTTPTLSPTIGYRNITEITCNNATISDTDNDSITWHYQWYINDTENATTQTISNTSYFKDDELICEIWADDGTVNSTKYNSTTLTILNSRPVITNVVIDPSPAGNTDNLNVTYTYYDIDGDAEVNTYFQWYINDAENETVRYLTSGNTSLNDNVIISIKADDGADNSTWLNSTTLTIGDSANPVLHTHYMSATSGYTNVAFTIGINVTESNTIDWVYVEINDPNADKTNYTMSVSQTNGTEHYYTKSYIPTIVGQYDFYFYAQDGSSNYDSLNGTQYYTASTVPTPPTSGGGGGSTIIETIIIQEALTNLTKVSPIEIIDIISLSSTKREEFRIENLDITPTNYTIEFNCDAYDDNKLCEYLKFRDIITGDRIDTESFTIQDRSTGYISYYLTTPDILDLGIYYADVVIKSSKNEIITIPLEYEITEKFSILDFIKEIPIIGIWLSTIFKSFDVGTDISMTTVFDEELNQTVQIAGAGGFETIDIYNIHLVVLALLGIGIYISTKNKNNFYSRHKIFKG